VGIDVGLKTYYTAYDGQTVENPHLFRKAEKRIKRLSRRLSRKKKGSKNRHKARKKLAKAHLKVSRQRKDFACKTARALVSSSDLVAYEDLKIRNLAKNRKLAKSIMDASWGLFLSWVRYYGLIHGIPIVAVSPHYTSQECSGCGCRVKKSLSVRTHVCPSCGLILDRDLNAALNILLAGYRTLGHRETGGPTVPTERLGTERPLLPRRKAKQ
jgi:putative transposase